MKRSDVVGHTITALLRDEKSFYQGEGLPGVSTGEMFFYSVFLELDGSELLYLGSHRKHDALRLVAPEKNARLVNLELDEGVPTCVGETIREVLVSCGSVFLYLSSARYLWIDDDLEGTELYLENEEYFTCRGAASALKMVTYWGGHPTDHGGGHLLDG